MGLLTSGCAGEEGGDASAAECDGAKCDDANGSAPQHARFEGFSENVDGIPGILPPTEALHPSYHHMTEDDRVGLAAWTLFASDGKFLRYITEASHGYVNVLAQLDSRDRDTRFEDYGVINDPGCRMANEPDEFGLFVDECDDPYSAGIVGLRLKPNPEFDSDLWEQIGGAQGHLAHPEETFDVEVDGEELELHGWEVEPPYLPALTCTICHAQPHPLNPPANPNAADWDEIAFSLGNQFFKEGVFLGARLPDNDFARELLLSQPPGTSDTSRVATDHIFNPNMINGVANLQHRRRFWEKATVETDDGLVVNPDIIFESSECISNSMSGCVDAEGTIDEACVSECETCLEENGECVNTYRVLKMGGDSSGPTGALLRVYINVGSCADLMLDAAGDFLQGLEPQRPISRARIHQECAEYQDMATRVVQTLGYLAAIKPYFLEDAPGGQAHLADDATIERGALVFADNCATCHSSVQPVDPAYDVHEPDTWFTEDRNAFFRELVMEPDFRETNYFADDRRYPVTLIGTNTARAFAGNATRGRIWAEYSSEDYKSLTAVEGIDVKFPLFDTDKTLRVRAPAGGRGYYRSASLLNLWSSAPFFNNNGLGLYNGRVDVHGRLEAFDDAAEKLLWPDRRLGKKTIRKTTRGTKLDTGLSLFGIRVKVPLPKGTPIDMFGNLGVALGRGEVRASDLLGTLTQTFDNVKEFLAGTDPIQDKGHTFGQNLTDEDKQALIEFLKTL